MKNKFEANVASEIPKTKAHEPELPWKLTDEQAAQSSPANDEYAAAISGTPPLKTRAPFLIMLVIVIFAITAYLISNALVENEKIRSNIAKKDSELSLSQIKLMRAVAEKETINKNSAQLEKKISDLQAQKELFTSVIESLTKKGDEPEAKPAVTPVAAQPAEPVVQ